MKKLLGRDAPAENSLLDAVADQQLQLLSIRPMPADLLVEQPIKFEFIVNLKAAKQIGVTIPPNVLVRADKVIKEASAKAGGR